jgi:hypothetical protein
MSKAVRNYLGGVLAFVAVGVIAGAIGTLILVVHDLIGSLPK